MPPPPAHGYDKVHECDPSGSEYIETKFVHVIYYPDRKRHDFSFYTNADVNENNVRKLAETYKDRLSRVGFELFLYIFLNWFLRM